MCLYWQQKIMLKKTLIVEKLKLQMLNMWYFQSTQKQKDFNPGPFLTSFLEDDCFSRSNFQPQTANWQQIFCMVSKLARNINGIDFLKNGKQSKKWRKKNEDCYLLGQFAFLPFGSVWFSLLRKFNCFKGLLQGITILFSTLGWTIPCLYTQFLNVSLMTML